MIISPQSSAELIINSDFPCIQPFRLAYSVIISILSCFDFTLRNSAPSAVQKGFYHV